MINRYPLLFALLFVWMFPGVAAAQLAPGDIAIIGLHSDGTDRFAWVPLVDLAPGQVVLFTDAGWNAAGNAFQRQINALANPATTSPSGGAIRYTPPPEGLPAGTVVNVAINSQTGGEPGTYTLTVSGARAEDFSGANDTDVVGDQGVSIATTGDKLFVLTGSLLQPVFIFGVNLSANRWHHNSTTTQYASDLPPGLSNGLTAVAIGAGPVGGDEVDNGRYVGPATGSRKALLAAISNMANWERSDEDIADLTHGTTAFTIEPPPLVTVAVDTVFVDRQDTGYVSLAVRVTPGHNLGSIRFRLVVERPAYARFAEMAVTDADPDVAIESAAGPSGDTLTLSIQADIALMLASGVPRLLGRIRMVSTSPARGVETALRLLDDASFSVQDTTGETIDRTGVSGMVQIGMRGDVNLDGKINVLDIIQSVNRLLGGQLPAPRSTAFIIADANRDGQVDVVDMVRIINIILRIPVDDGPTGKRTAGAPARAYLGMVQKERDGTLTIPMFVTGQSAVAGLDALIAFDPARLSFAAPRLSIGLREAIFDHIITGGQLRIVGVCLSEGGVMVSGPYPLLSIPVTRRQGEGNIPILSSLALIDPQGRNIPVEIVAPARIAVSEEPAPTRFSLRDNVPNPFNPATEIAYNIPQTAHVTLAVYNMIGQEIVRLVDKQQEPGHYRVIWEGRNTRGDTVGSGVYLYRLISGGYTATRRMTLVK